MGLFDKKYCDICGNKIGFLGNRKLEDGNLCKDCAHKLSPWFDERRHSSIQQIKEQLAYREQNQPRAAAFHCTKSFGDDSMKMLIDENARTFMVTRSKNYAEDNPDVIDISQITGCDLDLDERRDEEKQPEDGKSTSQQTPRYEYSYNFKVTIHVRHPYFDEVYFQLNSTPVRTGEHDMGSSRETRNWRRSNESNYLTRYELDDYYKYLDMGNELKETINGWLRNPVSAPANENMRPEPPKAEASNHNSPWVCQCGAQNTGSFCEYCGTPRP